MHQSAHSFSWPGGFDVSKRSNVLKMSLASSKSSAGVLNGIGGLSNGGEEQGGIVNANVYAVQQGTAGVRRTLIP